MPVPAPTSCLPLPPPAVELPKPKLEKKFAALGKPTKDVTHHLPYFQLKTLVSIATSLQGQLVKIGCDRHGSLFLQEFVRPTDTPLP